MLEGPVASLYGSFCQTPKSVKSILEPKLQTLETIFGNLPSKSVCDDKNKRRFNICNCQLLRVTDWHPINKHAPVTWGRLRLQMTRENVEKELEPYAIPGYIMLYPCPGATYKQCFGNLQQRLLLSALGLSSLENRVMAIWQYYVWARKHDI